MNFRKKFSPKNYNFFCGTARRRQIVGLLAPRHAVLPFAVQITTVYILIYYLHAKSDAYIYSQFTMLFVLICFEYESFTHQNDSSLISAYIIYNNICMEARTSTLNEKLNLEFKLTSVF